MDTNSRNIVKFIATVTVAALLIMAARYYSMSGPVEAPPVAAEIAMPKPSPVETPVADEEPVEESEVTEEDVEIKMGEPSVNIVQESAGYQEMAPPP
ncbi:MAG: hypothetical protein ACRETL_14675, partial [Gammaproteobacteria bacterium]